MAKEAYLLLKDNFNRIGRYDDASWAYVKEQQMEKMAHYWEWCRRKGYRVRIQFIEEPPYQHLTLRRHPLQAPGRWGAFWRWLRNWAYELLTGYGERVHMPAVWALVVVALFAVTYGLTGNISADFAGDPGQAHGSHNPIDALTHSVGAFATIGFNTLEPLGWGARLLTAIESALGIGIFALFVFTLGNRMSRS